LLEHPAEAFAYFRREGVARVVCEEKHMGSRVVVIVCRSEDAARRRFGIVEEGVGICYTRTERRFFDNAKIGKEFLEKVRVAVDAAGFWQQFETDWICLDAELMPWSRRLRNYCGSNTPLWARLRKRLVLGCPFSVWSPCYFSSVRSMCLPVSASAVFTMSFELPLSM